MAEYAYQKHTPRIWNGSSFDSYSPYIWNGSAWVEHSEHVYSEVTATYLFNNGDQCTDLTGGWSYATYTYQGKTCLFRYYGSADGYSDLRPQTQGKVSLSGYSKLYFKYWVSSVHGSGNGGFGMDVDDASGNTLADVIINAPDTSTGWQTGVVDISSVDVDCYIKTWSWYASFYVCEVWLE